MKARRGHRIRRRTVFVARRLTRAQAIDQARRKSPGDFRAAKYYPGSGMVILL